MLVTGNEEDQTQLWSLEDADGSARFINKVSGLAIGIANDDMTSGNNLVLTEKSDSSIYQLWNVINKSTSATLEQPDIPNYAGPIEEPSEPSDPSDPSDPSEPTDPSDPSDPSEPSDPSDPSDPSEPSDPSDPSDPSEPADPSDPSDPSEPTDSSEPADTSGPDTADTVTASSDSAVQTGDNTSVIIPIVFMFASSAAVVWLTVKRNRFRQEK